MERKRVRTQILAFLIMLLASGCGTTTKIIKEPVYQKIDCGVVSRPQPIVMKPVEPINLGKEGWMLTHQDYKNLSDNFDSIIRWMEQANLVMDFYEQCMREYNKSNEEF